MAEQSQQRSRRALVGPIFLTRAFASFTRGQAHRSVPTGDLSPHPRGAKRSPLRALAAFGAALALLALSPAPASATGATFKRAFENLTQFPLDVITSPIVAGKAVVTNMQAVGDTTDVRIFYALPGFVWNTMVDAGAGMIRGIAGVLELGPGVVMLYSDKEMQPLFEPVEDNNALVDLDSSLYRLKFGVDYTTPGE